MSFRRLLATLLATLSLSGCAHTSRDAWKKVVKRCADSDLLGEMTFLGPSNVLGPGTVWSAASDGGYLLRYRMDSFLNGVPDAGFIQKGASMSCAGTDKTEWSLDAGLPITGKTVNLDADLAAKLKQAKNVVVKTSSVNLDLLVTGPYEGLLRTLKDPVRQEMFSGKRLVITRAIRVAGFVADFTFESDAAGSVKAALPANGIIAVGPGGANLSVAWKNSNTLAISSPDEFYIAADFNTISADGVALGGGPASVAFVPAKPSQDAKYTVPTP